MADEPRPGGAYEAAFNQRMKDKPKERTWKTKAEKLEEAKERYRLARSSQDFYVTHIPEVYRRSVRQRDLGYVDELSDDKPAALADWKGSSASVDAIEDGYGRRQQDPQPDTHIKGSSASVNAIEDRY